MERKPDVPIDLVVKFGGSAITDKSRLETLKEDNLKLAVDVIRKCVERGLRCVVVHGAGSFGHHHAKEYEVNNGVKGLPEEVKRRRYGMCLTRISVTKVMCLTRISVTKVMCLTRISVTKLNHLVVRSLVENDVNAIGLPAAGFWVTDTGKISRHGVTGIMELLDNGFVPVLHGDCVLDISKGCHILSGDVIIKTLCKEHLVNRVVFLSDVTGVYDKPPSETDAKHISKICVGENGKIMADISTTSSPYDVTGGMLLKICTAMDIVTGSGGKTKVYVTKVGSGSVNPICLGLDTGQLDHTTFTEIIHQT
ncbi:isopentenyl phosphate kinase-like isoform X2 [Pecten maximus]|uniref:isopentenyl phosphate kinase-like isoform X2 n=1 Tax=Pecten maximus TaxID=6579 RepID=UPI001458F4B9|nr:isopentenyl phosphate kinase-like isoform X2 [Pecten maximus]